MLLSRNERVGRWLRRQYPCTAHHIVPPVFAQKYLPKECVHVLVCAHVCEEVHHIVLLSFIQTWYMYMYVKHWIYVCMYVCMYVCVRGKALAQILMQSPCTDTHASAHSRNGLRLVVWGNCTHTHTNLYTSIHTNTHTFTSAHSRNGLRLVIQTYCAHANVQTYTQTHIPVHLQQQK